MRSRTESLGRWTTGALALALATACAGTTGTGTPDGDGGNAGSNLAADFSLLDVNATSPTSGQSLGPADYAGDAATARPTAWYFGHAT